jgi:hypothetical protein
VEMQRGPGATQCEAEARHGGGGWVARGGAAAQPGGGGAARCSWRRSERGVHMWERARQRKMDPKKRIGPQKNGCSVEDSLISDFSFPLDHNAPTLA